MLATSTHSLLADQYLDRLAFGWQRRTRALDSHVLDFATLCQIDQTLQACVQALALTGSAAQTLIAARLEDPLTRGELFAIALHSMAQNDSALHHTCMGLVMALPALRSAYLAALEWSCASNAWWALQQWQQQAGAAGFAWLFDVLALALYRMHPELQQRLANTLWWQQLHQRSDNSPALDYALLQTAQVSPSPQALARANALLESPIAQLRALAAEIVLWQTPHQSLLQQTAVDVLSQLAGNGAVDGSEAASAAVFALACWPGAEFAALLATLENQPGQRRLYLQALGWRGDIRAVPRLCACLPDPPQARLAAASLSMLTGSMPARDGWQAAPSEKNTPGVNRDSDLIEVADPDASLPPPDPHGFARWWSQNRQRFASASGWLAGRPRTEAGLNSILQDGKLAWRSIAARHLQANIRSGASLNTSAPAAMQLQWLRNHSTSQVRRQA